MNVTRGAFVATSLATLAAPAFAAEPSLTAVRVGATPDVDIVTALWAVQSGTFANDGLDVTIQRLNSGAAVAAGVIGHSVDIGRSSIFGLLRAHLKGVPFELISMSAIYDSAAPNSAFVVATDSPITSARDLEGKTIATPSFGDYFTLVTSAWVDANGGDSHSLKFVAMPIPLAAQAIKAGRIDGTILVDPFLQEALLPSGGGRILGYPSNAIAPKYGVTYYFCLRSYARQHAAAVASFQRAIATATAYAQTHKSEMDPLVVRYTDIDSTIVAKMPLDIGSGLNPRMLQPVIDFAARFKFIAHPFPAAEISVPHLATSG